MRVHRGVAAPLPTLLSPPGVSWFPPAGYFVDPATGKCTPCKQSNCEECSSAATCDSCDSGYGKTPSGSCAACGEGCSWCEVAGQCSQCAEGYTKAADGKSCLKCTAEHW